MSRHKLSADGPIGQTMNNTYFTVSCRGFVSYRCESRALCSSLSIRRKILPDGDLGMESLKTIPPVSRLYGESRLSMKVRIDWVVTFSPVRTMWACGCSCPSLYLACVSMNLSSKSWEREILLTG